MAMTKAEKAELIAIFEGSLKNFKQIEILERELITQQLDRIEEKTIEIKERVEKTNGSVLRHTEEIFQLKQSVQHTVDGCPQKDIIEKLHNNYQQNAGIAKWKTVIIAALASIAGAVGAVIAVVEYVLKDPK